ncbi:hypothetical protein CARUB_v10025001mg, partial [Capsella rubella]
MMISDLPNDLESEILSRVPTKSLANLQTTCKRWYTLLKDSYFVKKNFGKDASKLMLMSNFRVYSISVDLHGIHNSVEPSIEFPGKLSRLKDSKDLEISYIVHCDGLMLCSNEGYTRLVVWNPCTGQTRRIKPRTRYRSKDCYALGYVKSKKSGHSYKILRSCIYQIDQEQFVSEFEIYYFSSDSWRVLDHFTRDYSLYCDGMSLKGNTYWVARAEETGFFILYFDFTKEIFGRFPLPFQSVNSKDTAALSVVKGEKIAVLHQNFLEVSNVMRIYLTNKIDESIELSWGKFVLAVDYDRFDLPSVVNVSSFLLDEENKVAVCSDVGSDGDEYKTRIYVVGEDIYKEVYKETTRPRSKYWPVLLLSYVPSLVHISKYIHKSNRRKKRTSRE